MAGVLLDGTADITVDGSDIRLAVETSPLPPPATDNSIGNGNRGEDKRKRRLRPKTLKRRLQNRMAQRRYREKQARMVAELRSLAPGSAGAHENESGDESLMDRDALELLAVSQCTSGSADQVAVPSSLGRYRGDGGQDIGDEIEAGERAQAVDPQDVEESSEHAVEAGLDLEFSRYFIPEILRVFNGTSASSLENCELGPQRTIVGQEFSRTHPSASTTIMGRSRSFPLVVEQWKSVYSPEGGEIADSSGYWKESMDVERLNLDSGPGRTAGDEEPSPMTASSNSNTPSLLQFANIDPRLDYLTSAVSRNEYRTMEQKNIQQEPCPHRIRPQGTFEKNCLVDGGTERNHETKDSTPVASHAPQSRPLHDQATSPRLQLLSSPSHHTPSASNLRLTRIATRDAYLANAVAIGLHIPSLYSPTCQSPFYRPRTGVPSNTTKTEDPRVSIAHLFTHIPEHLRPTPPQVLCPHHPYLDLLPFPILRARAIALAARRPPLIDVGRLKQDLMDGGLICWSTAGGTASAAGGGGGGCGGRAWDTKSWEATPWFLRRWGLLVGGREGEVWRQSVWWREFRGEDGDGEGV